MRERIRVIAHKGDPTERAKQSMRDECDINKIMEKYRNGGEIQHINKAQARYGDFANGLDFTRAYTAIASAEAAFSELPAHIRDIFGNDPEAFLYQMEDPAIQEKLRALGVFDPEVGPLDQPIKSAPILDTQSAPGGTEVPGEEQPSPSIMDQPSGTTEP